ncbi:MAG: leucine-rich repeat domain-containing protein [Promethearchaeota archaeon]
MGNLELLQILNLSNNQISVLPESFKNLKSLHTLDLSNNQISIFPEVIMRLDSLKTLNIRKNPFTKKIDSNGKAVIKTLKKNGIKIKK